MLLGITYIMIFRNSLGTKLTMYYSSQSNGVCDVFISLGFEIKKIADFKQ